MSAIVCGNCGRNLGATERPVVSRVLAREERLTGTLQISHQEFACPACRERTVVHVREHSLLKLSFRRRLRCGCRGAAEGARAFPSPDQLFRGG